MSQGGTEDTSFARFIGPEHRRRCVAESIDLGTRSVLFLSGPVRTDPEDFDAILAIQIPVEFIRDGNLFWEPFEDWMFVPDANLFEDGTPL